MHQAAALADEADRIKNGLPHVTLVQPRPAPATSTTLLPGNVEALEETTVYPHTSGYLKRWLVDIGDEVKDGQLLAEIDTPDVDKELAQAKANLQQFKANQIRSEATAKLNEAIKKRYDELDLQNAASKLEVDQHRADAETAESNVAAAKASVAAAEADVQRLTTLEDFSKVFAPFAGTITARYIEVGQLVTSGNGTGQTLFHIAKTNPVRVFVHVPQMYAPGIKVDQEAELLVRELPNRKFVGRVTRTARAIDPATRTLLTEIQAPNDDHALLTGSYIQVRLNVARASPPLLIPASALIFNADGTRVALVDATGKAHFQPVEVEGDFGAEIGVSSGLSPQDRVIVAPGSRLVEGGAVEVEAAAKK
jgi:RND family efflux transporter MFP subunit